MQRFYIIIKSTLGNNEQKKSRAADIENESNKIRMYVTHERESSVQINHENLAQLHRCETTTKKANKTIFYITIGFNSFVSAQLSVYICY